METVLCNVANDDGAIDSLLGVGKCSGSVLLGDKYIAEREKK